MKQLEVSDDLFAVITAVAEREQVSLNEALHTLVIGSKTFPVETAPLLESPEEHAQRDAALENFFASLDVDITDLSMTVRETMNAYWQKKASDYADSD